MLNEYKYLITESEFETGGSLLRNLNSILFSNAKNESHEQSKKQSTVNWSRRTST